ncbi:MAG: hypothetical protein ABI779_04095 [Acidobacteriota bacterium]
MATVRNDQDPHARLKTAQERVQSVASMAQQWAIEETPGLLKSSPCAARQTMSTEGQNKRAAGSERSRCIEEGSRHAAGRGLVIDQKIHRLIRAFLESICQGSRIRHGAGEGQYAPAIAKGADLPESDDQGVSPGGTRRLTSIV